jgi:hypothetical protein
MFSGTRCDPTFSNLQPNTGHMGKQKKLYIYSRRRVARKGRRDGRGYRWSFWPLFKIPETVYPLEDQDEQAAYEKELHRCCEENVSRFSEEWKAYDRKAKPAYCHRKKEFELAQEAWEEACKDVMPVRESYDRAKREYAELPVPAWPSWVEWVATALAVLLEGPGLAYAYQLMGASKLETYLMAGLAVVVVPFSALFWGQKLRKAERTAFDRGMLVAIPAVFMVALIGFTAVRIGLFESIKMEQTFETTLGDGSVSAVFFTVTLLSFMLCAVVSYGCAHKYPEVHRKLKRHLKEAAALLRQEQEDVEEAKELRDKAELAYLSTREERRKKFELLKAEVNNWIEKSEYLVQVYRTHNITARPGRKAPPCLKGSMREVQHPPELLSENLDWDCPDTNGGRSFDGIPSNK